MTYVKPRRARTLNGDIILLAGVIIGSIITMILSASFYLLIDSNHNRELSSVQSTLNGKIRTLTSTYQTKLDEANAQIRTLTAEINGLESDIDGYKSTVDTLTTNYSEDSGITMSLVKKYSYVIKDAPEGQGVTLELIAFADQLCQEKNVNPHLVWGIIHYESGYIANARNSNSNARGLGQFMERTARSIYEDYLHLGTYIHDLAYDPYINIQLIVEYLRIINTRCSNNIDVLNEYGGYTAGQYYRTVKQYMDSVGTDITVTTYY